MLHGGMFVKNIMSYFTIMAILSLLIPIIPGFNKWRDHVLIGVFLIAYLVILVFSAFAHASYFTLRTGGKILITILMDSFYMWVAIVPLSLILANFTSMPIEILYPVCQGAELLKIFIAGYFLLKGNWAERLVAEDSESDAEVPTENIKSE